MDKRRFFLYRKTNEKLDFEIFKGGTFKRKNRDFEAPQKPL